MNYCSNCGNRLGDNDKFCPQCGTPVGQQGNSRYRFHFDGELHKCPNCGELLKSFELNCPACGYELRGIKGSSAIKEFALKLETIEANREPPKNKGVFSILNAQVEVSKTDKQKISLIRSFAIPNTKEDILEFMILATSKLFFTRA